MIINLKGADARSNGARLDMTKRSREPDHSGVGTVGQSQRPCPSLSPVQVTETVEITGHLMDTGVLARILDDVLDYGGDYTIERFEVGKTHEDESHARIGVLAESNEDLQRLLPAGQSSRCRCR